MMAACSSNETIEVNENKGDLISFRPIVKGVTRAADADLSSDATSFNVEAFNTGTTTSPYFSNVTYTNSGGTFTSATKYYWPTNNLDFYAYSPITTDVEGDQKGALSNGDYQIVKTEYKTFTIKPSTTVSEQVDFIYANTNNKDKGSSGEVTTLNFRHAGAKIVVKVKNSAPNLKFEISGWKLGYLDNSATFTYGDATTDTKDGAQLAFSDWSENTTQSAANTYSTEFTANAIAASQSTAYFLGNAGTPSTSATDESLNMILIPQTLTAATAYASTTAGAKPNGSYIALKMVIKNNTDAGETVADATADGKWAIWPIGGYNWEPGKKYTYTIDLAGGGYYETNQADTDGNLDAILEGAEIKFATVTVDGWANYPKSLDDIYLSKVKQIVDESGDATGYLGWIIASDGSIFPNLSALNAAEKTGVAMIAYVGSNNAENAPYNHGLAIAMSDANNGTVSQYSSGIDFLPSDSYNKTGDNVLESGLQYRDETHNSINYPGFKCAFENNNIASPSGTSNWFLPTAWQWRRMMDTTANGGMGNSDALTSAFESRGGANLQTRGYLTSSHYDSSQIWYKNEFGNIQTMYKHTQILVRSVVAF